MKFAIELESELVPEWRAKYLDYNQGKKKIAAFSRAWRNVHTGSTITDPTRRRTSLSYFTSLPSLLAPHNPSLDRIRNEAQSDTLRRKTVGDYGLAQPISISTREVNDPERQPLRDDFYAQKNQDALPKYGSIVGSPSSIIGSPVVTTDWDRPKRNSVHFELPNSDPSLPSHPHREAELNRKHSPLIIVDNGSNYDADENKSAPENTFSGRYSNSDPIRKIMSLSGNIITSSDNAPPEGYCELNSREAEIFDFLDSELEKIEYFYKVKEEQATERLKVIREQLHVMRDCHIDELVKAKSESMRANLEGTETDGKDILTGQSWLEAMDSALETARHTGSGKQTEGMKDLPSFNTLREADAHRDYIRHAHEVPYRTAKTKLKAAIHEFYRGLELLKSYALLNRKAFRKMNKKFDKAANAPPTLHYMSEKVNEAYFVKSHVLGDHLRAVEDLYARYFEGGNYKVATSKLRASIDRPNDYNGVVFRNGLMAATGLWFGLAGLNSAYQLLYQPNLTLALNTNYLLQIYAGYFLMLFLMLLFCIDCRIWSLHKVNYVFVFEFDTRHHLDWRQLAELPCVCLLLLGLFLWLNFTTFGEKRLFLLYPAILIGLTAVMIFLPAPTFFYRSRRWFLYANWRLFFSGLYPVEFRDFFMGDMFCSLTYSFGNIELLFCLYGHDWNSPDLCNSGHSRLLGFFSTLPGIWRALQCLRRYWDTGNKFPHLANFLKYLITVLYYISLSIYRLNKTNDLFAMFIAFATINSFYCSVWDLVMDWSLLDPFASKKFLRDNLAFRPVWIYYTAMVIDPILRFNWIFYAIYKNDTRHSAIISFLIAFSEIIRRGVWTIFRVENEHCTNIGRFRASRDFPLPYPIEHHVEQGYVLVKTHEDATLHEEHRRQGIVPPLLTRMSSYTSGWSILGMHTDHSGPSPTVIRRKKRLESRPFLKRVGDILHTAHAQDFERKKKTGSEEIKRNKEEEEEDVLDKHGSKVDDVKVEVARRVAEAVAEQAAKTAVEAEEEENALNKLAWGSDGRLGESSAGMEGRVKQRFKNLEDIEGLSENGELASPGIHEGKRA